MPRRTRWALLLWPGLPHIWLLASWSGLGVAVLAAGLLNVALAGTLVWSELLPEGLRTALWLGVAMVWGGAGAGSWRLVSSSGTSREHPGRDAMFRRATEQYLKGDWLETERTLRKLLRNEPRDTDARLLLATLLRHVGRLDEALLELDLLGRLERGLKWELEVRRERELIAQARAEEEQQEEEENHSPTDVCGAETPARAD